jgi:ferredoxin/menaquinone-dependent protoporphyrinogen IX oxidase
MKFKKVYLYYYSPTGSTRTIINKIADSIDVEPINLIANCITYPEFVESCIEPVPDDLVVIGAPVYAGRIALTAVERLNKINFAGNMAVLVAVYGNRDYNDALIELRELARQAGLKPVAAAAFIGEHSYSTGRDQIAHGRPDSEDKQKAIAFGRQISEVIAGLEAPPVELEVPGNLPLPERHVLPDAAPETVAKRCIKCGVCQTVCPAGAVFYKNGYHTNSKLCTLCFACVKSCKQNARVVESPELGKIKEWLLNTTQTRREPEVFIQQP